MKEKRNILTKGSLILNILLLGIIVVLLLLKNCNPKPNPKYWIKPNFVSDTIRYLAPYPIKGDSFPYHIPPKTIIKYLKDTSNHNILKYEKDSLLSVINKLGNKLASINQDFLTQFPTSPKLIGGMFTRDTLKLDLLKIDGKIFSEIYPVDYNQYQYQWNKDKLNGTEFQKPKPHKVDLPKPRLLSTHLYAYTGFELLSKKPKVSAEYYIQFRRYKLAIEPAIWIQRQPILELQTKLGYRIK